jgi:hypothetical protein
LRRARGLFYSSDDPMASRSRETRVRVDDDGVRTVETPRPRRVLWLIGLAVALPVAATIVAILVIRTLPNGHAVARVAEPAVPDEPLPAAQAAPRAAPTAKPLAAVAAPLRPVRRAEQPKAVPTPAEEKLELSARDAIPALIAAGETGGITVFPLPGTKPIKRGLLVPDDFELPEGYVRHYQATDDGERVPAILMFHPDYDFVDDRGEPVTVPEDRVVPPELAPRGLPIEMLEVPEQHASDAP